MLNHMWKPQHSSILVTNVTNLTVWWLSTVHLVDSYDELFHTQRVGQEGMLTRLPILRDTSLKLSRTSRDNQYSTVSLRVMRGRGGSE